jgi:ectoine hydroxylase-related dioxygenase (phytanoyl-CoA dioxygenase family)
MSENNETAKMPFDLDRLSATYESDGVIFLRQLFSSEEVTAFRQMLAEYARDRAPTLPKGEIVYESDGVTVRNYWRLDKHEPRFIELLCRPHLLTLLRRLVHGEPVLAAIETFNKPARIGSRVPYHQDNSYFCQSPPDMLTVWISIDAVTEANGPVFFIKGSQKLGELPTKASGVSGNSIGMAEPPLTPLAAQFCALLSPGDATIHHCNTIHHSAPNTTDCSRLGLLLVFRGSHTKTDPALKARYTAAQTTPNS